MTHYEKTYYSEKEKNKYRSTILWSVDALSILNYITKHDLINHLKLPNPCSIMIIQFLNSQNQISHPFNFDTHTTPSQPLIDKFNRNFFSPPSPAARYESLSVFDSL